MQVNPRIKAVIHRKLSVLSEVVGSNQTTILGTIYVNDLDSLEVVLSGMQVDRDYIVISFSCGDK